MRLLLLALLTLPGTCGRAQSNAARLPFPPEFLLLSDSMDLLVADVHTAAFKSRPAADNDYLKAHLTLYNRREKLEMRFHLQPHDPTHPLSARPGLRTHTVAMNLGSNDDDAVTTVHSYGPEELAVLNADWARLYTFRPKRGYSDREHAQLVAIYREGQGLAYTVLLFNKIPGTLEDRQLSLRFR